MSDAPELEDERRRDAAKAVVVTLVMLAGSAACILASPEGLHHFDDITHFLFARWAWEWPSYLLDHWGRPGFTVPYFLPAGLGWTADKLLSAVLSAAAGWFAFRLAQHAGLRHAWAAALLTWAQPLYFQLSQTTLTETPLAFYLSVALLMAVRGRWEWSSALLSLGFVTRHEAVLFLPIWLWFAWRAGAPWWRLWPMVWAPAVVNVAAWAMGMTTPIELYLRPKPSGQYGADGWYTFFARSLHAWGPGVSLLAFAGLTGSFRREGGSDGQKVSGIDGVARQTNRLSHAARQTCGRHEAPAREMVFTCIAAYFAAQTVIRMFGLFDSGGYARFLVPIGPLVGVAALGGWNGLTSRDTGVRRRFALSAVAVMALLWLSLELQVSLHSGIDIEFPKVREAQIAMRFIAGVVVCAAVVSVRSDSRFARLAVPGLAAALLLMAGYLFHRPLPRPEEAAIIEEALSELDERGLGDRPIISALTWVDYVKDQTLAPHRRRTDERIADAPVGAVVAWERQFAGSVDHGLSLEEFERSAAFRALFATRPKAFRDQPYLYLFEKVAPWPGDSQAKSP